MKHVVPNPKLPENEYVKGVGAAGAELPDKEADALIKAGLVIESKPKPAAPANKSEE